MGFFSSIAKVFTGGSSAIDKTIDIVAEKVEDTDKRNDLIAKVVLSQIEADAKGTIPLVDAIHKMGRQLMMFALSYWYYESWKAGNPIPIEDFMLIAAGPGVYTMVKGRGQ